MMLYKNTKVNVRTPDGDTDYFKTVTGVLQIDTFATDLLIICRDYELRRYKDLMKENGFTLARKKKNKKQNILSTNYYGRRLRQWHIASGKYIRQSWITDA